jgi:hypothetical protein
MAHQSATVAPQGFDAMGEPIPFGRRQRAYDAIRNDMLPDSSVEDAMSLVNRVADQLERDNPYMAMKEATDAPVNGSSQQGTVGGGVRLDYTGAIRLFATLLTGD